MLELLPKIKHYCWFIATVGGIIVLILLIWSLFGVERAIDSLIACIAIIALFKEKMMVLFKPKPLLKISDAQVVLHEDKLPSLELKIKNDRYDANWVECEWAVIRKDTGEVICDSRDKERDLGTIPFEAHRNVSFKLSGYDSSKPHTLVISLFTENISFENIRMPLKTQENYSKQR